jgi:hypothetical protein
MSQGEDSAPLGGREDLSSSVALLLIGASSRPALGSPRGERGGVECGIAGNILSAKLGILMSPHANIATYKLSVYFEISLLYVFAINLDERYVWAF